MFSLVDYFILFLKLSTSGVGGPQWEVQKLFLFSRVNRVYRLYRDNLPQ